MHEIELGVIYQMAKRHKQNDKAYGLLVKTLGGIETGL